MLGAVADRLMCTDAACSISVTCCDDRHTPVSTHFVGFPGACCSRHSLDTQDWTLVWRVTNINTLLMVCHSLAHGLRRMRSQHLAPPLMAADWYTDWTGMQVAAW